MIKIVFFLIISEFYQRRNPYQAMDSFWLVFLKVVSVLFLVTSIAIAVIIVLEKRSPFKTAAWILALVLLPVFGLLFYLFFGQEYRKRKMFSRKGLRDLGRIRKRSSKQLREINQTHLKLGDHFRDKENLISLLLNNSQSLLTTGNRIKILNDGALTFKALFSAIEAATHHIHLEYYIIENDRTGNELKELLIKKCMEGIEVRVIVDDVGSWGLNRKFFRDLRSAGIEIFPFMEVRFPRLTSRFNYRNHRKIVVIDGKIGFTGGINIADRYQDGLKGIGSWRDTHIQIEGDAVACLQVIFCADWFFVTRKIISGKKYFPPLSESKGVPVQITASGPDTDWETIGQGFFAAISGARKSVFIVTPYLMPPHHIHSALITASLGNVDIKILIPEKSDARISKWCSFSYVEELLEAGIKVYFYQGGFIHSKLLLVDGKVASVGTANLDFRSLETNFEVNAFIYDDQIVGELTMYFIKDLQSSREIKLEEWKKRPWHYKLRESLAHIVSPML